MLHWLPVQTNSETTFIEMFYLGLSFECVLMYLNCFKKQKTKIQRLLVYEKNTVALNIHLFSTTQYVKNIKEERSPEIKSSKVRGDS